jgi:hypothetical protein
MRAKKYTHGLTFFITLDMYNALKQLSDEKQVSISELLRGVLDNYIGQNYQPKVVCD